MCSRQKFLIYRILVFTSTAFGTGSSDGFKVKRGGRWGKMLKPSGETTKKFEFESCRSSGWTTT